MNYKLPLISLLSLMLLQACSTTPKPTLQLEDVPVLFEVPDGSSDKLASDEAALMTDDAITAVVNDGTAEVEVVNNSEACGEIKKEIEKIDAGLGSSAIEQAPNTEGPSGIQRTGSYIYNLFTQTLLGVFQPIIQTKRAIFNDDEKDRRMSESVQRGETRRAYLMGYAEANGCNKVEGETITPSTVE